MFERRDAQAAPADSVGRWQVANYPVARIMAVSDSRKAPCRRGLAAEHGPALDRTHGGQTRPGWVNYRLFFMTCAELRGHDLGRERLVSHYLFEKR